MASFSKLAAPVVYGVFEQKYKYGNYASVKILGLFIRGEFVGCAMLSFEQARSIKISDMGGLYLLPEHNTGQNREMLYLYAIKHALDKQFLPVNGGTEAGEKCIRLGYTPVGKRYTFTNI
ncbi:MAG: hypothetical protein GX254_11510 [Clostridiales bacterium]|jgi:hypothetical protein|nr:hypothetical protein [Clostridiales bacterium]